MTPTQRTLATFRELGFTVGVVEKWNPHCRIRQDLFGCIDLVAMRPDSGIVGLQACAGASHAARRAKAMAEPKLRTWLESGARFEVVSWSKRNLGGKRGARKVWTLRRDEITLADITN